jgi:pilus assembly protein FimV
MKALFAVNPQAFSKPNMNSLKVGTMLRVPTLREIVDSTGSKAAKQLLDQQQSAEIRAVKPAEGDRISSPPPAPVETAEPVSPQPAVAAPDDALSESGVKVFGPVPDGIVASPAPTPPENSESVSGAEPTTNVPAIGTSPATEIPPASGASPAN